MARTYIPQLSFWAHFGHKYATRWQPKLEQSMTSDQYTCLLTWISATAALLICLGAPTIDP